MSQKDLDFIKKIYQDKTDLSGRLSFDHARDTAEYLRRQAEKFKEISGRDLRILYRAALGHDLLEDTPARPEQIAKIWGADTLKQIRKLTNRQGDSDFSHYLAKLKKSSEETLLIKFADIYSNVRNSAGNRRLDLKWAKSFWLPLLHKYQKALLSRKFRKYPLTAQPMKEDIEKNIKILQSRIKNNK